MAQALIDRQLPAGSPGVHALVVGVGHYDDASVAGLAGAAPSALAFAEWLLTKQTLPGLALGSIDVLASQPSGAPVTWQGASLPAPNCQALQDAVDGWHARAAGSPDNLAVFYFCGHGIELGGLQSLMLADLNLGSADPFGNAIAFDELVRGMDSCGARRQLFVIDACRELPVGFNRWDDVVGLGRPFVRFNFKARAALTPRTHVVLQAASATQKAWAGEPRGWFTDALLAVLDGAAGDNRFSADEHQYPVNTRDIAPTIEFLVRNDFLGAPAGPQSPVRNGTGDFDLHLPSRPVVPVVVTRAAPEANAGARFTATRGGAEVAAYDCPDVRPWRAWLDVGDYEFRRDVDVAPVRVDVPAKKVELP